jgi:adenosylmethionine-8-amino-7-oxononanoate aminotransferase
MLFPVLVTRKAWERGLILRPMLETTGLVPPLCTTREDVDEIVAIIAASAKEAMADIEARRAAKKKAQ